MAESRAHTVKSAQRVLEVIEFFSEERPAASVTEISRALSYPQSSTSVLLRCLRDLGYLHYDRDRRTYRLTTRAALLGCWAESGNYRGGRALDMVDAVAARTRQTVVLSKSHVDYALHHLHVRQGAAPGAFRVEPGAVEPILNNVQGEFQLATYPDGHIRLALHRLNAEEPDEEKRVNISEKLAELRLMRERGWAIGPHATAKGISAVATLITRKRGGDRVVVSIVAADAVIEGNATEFVRIILEERARQFGLTRGDDQPRESGRACEMGMPAPDVGAAPAPSAARRFPDRQV